MDTNGHRYTAHVSLTRALHRALKAAAAKDGVKVSTWLRKLIASTLATEPETKEAQ